jgi:hypothetical protein
MSEIIENIIKMIDQEIGRYDSAESLVSKARNSKLAQIKEYLITNGFPQTEKDKLELSLHPYYFQEVNYDDLDIYTINGDRGHLTIPYDIDLAVQTGGYTRENVSEETFTEYQSLRGRVIDYLRK